MVSAENHVKCQKAFYFFPHTQQMYIMSLLVLKSKVNVLLFLRYNELDASKSLLDNLKGKVIIEYPTLFVVLKTLKNDMVVLGQGEHIFISCYVILGYFSYINSTYEYRQE